LSDVVLPGVALALSSLEGNQPVPLTMLPDVPVGNWTIILSSKDGKVVAKRIWLIVRYILNKYLDILCRQVQLESFTVVYSLQIWNVCNV
jgi:hypothetical protein